MSEVHGIVSLYSREKYRAENLTRLRTSRKASRGFPGGAVVKNPPANAGDTDGFKP